MRATSGSQGLAAATLLVVSLLAGWLVPWTVVSAAFVPDLLLLAVVAIATRRPREEAMLLAAAGGLAADTFSASTFATRAMVLVMVAWAAGWLGERVNSAAWPARLLLVAAGMIGADLLGRLVSHLVHPGAEHAPAAGLWSRLLSTAVVALVVWRAPAPRSLGRTA